MATINGIVWRRVHSFLIAVLVVASSALAAPVLAQAEPPAPVPLDELPWAIRLGGRVNQVQQVLPTIDRVVLVPDAATYVDELFKWSPRGRWPILFEDDQLAPMFIRRFRPAQIIRRDSVGALPPTAQAKRRVLEAVVVSAWGGDPALHTIRQVFELSRYVPPGVVIASTEDPAWTAAVALAAGRGECLAWLDETFRVPNQVLAPEAARQLSEQIERLVQEQQYEYRELGDQIDAITLCRAVAGRVEENPFPASRVNLPGLNTQGPIATTDLVGRREDGQRYAFTGWIFGSEARSAYVAMCSLFLDRDDWWLVNTYPDQSQWQAYGMQAAVPLLTGQGVEVQSWFGERAGLASWRRSLIGGIQCDVLLLNSKGMADFFDLSEGTGFAHDVPILDTPLALHMIHSWSLRSPENRDTVGGRWLEHGVYAYVGAMQEPYLGAFIPPELLVRRLLSFVPFLVAARHWDGPVGNAWRVNTFGDPLMLCRPLVGPDGTPSAARIDLPAEYGTDLREQATAIMRQIEGDERGAIIADAITALVLLGRDEIAVQMWRVARQKGLEAAVAAVSLGPLFRMRQEDEFLVAYAATSGEQRNGLAQDMLWHLLGPQLNRSLDEDAVLLLQSSLRRPMAHVDLERLAPQLRRIFGEPQTRGIIQRELERATSDDERKNLQKLLQRY